jgi:UDP-GlcNAc:undecaprenyl-phosphate GlcNAc-1-phosphate transferase
MTQLFYLHLSVGDLDSSKMPLDLTKLGWPLLAFILAVILYGVSLKLFPKIGLLDFPERYGLSRPRLPYPAGIVAVVTFLIFLLILEPWTRPNLAMAAAIVILGIVCFIDDRKTLHPLLRLGTQIGIAVLLFVEGARIYSLTNPLEGLVGGPVIPLDIYTVIVGPYGPLSIVGLVFTILWLGLTINALNWFDGIPGQVSTITLIGFLTIGFLSLSDRVNDPALAKIAFILAAIATAGLLFDFPPPKIVMGDTASMFFGLMLGLLTINAGKGKVATAFLVLGVPLVDSIIVAVRRMLNGKSPLRGSPTGEHLHHRLLARGWNPRTIIFLTAGIGTLFGVTALFLNTFEKFVAGVLLVLLMLGLHWYSRPEPQIP